MNQKLTNEDENEDESNNNLALLPKTIILFRPHTGKTHQLRVAAKSLGMPIIGDPDYSDKSEAKYMERTYLHALALHVTVQGENISIYNPPKSWYGIDESAQHTNGVEEVMASIMKKHCDCEDLMDIMAGGTSTFNKL